MDRLLLVDDDTLILLALERVLRAEGYDVQSFRDPREALEACHRTTFTAVISDFMMPHLNGIDLLMRIRELQPHATRVLLTAAVDFRVATDAVNRGEIFRLLGKPWTLPELSACVRQAVNHHHLAAENRRLDAELRRKNDELHDLNQHLGRLVHERTRGLLEGLMAALDVRDAETQWHSRRVAGFTRRLAVAAGATPAEQDVIEQGALLHDLGKMGVRDSVLLKPTRLTPGEWEEMRLHPEMGYRILARVPYFQEAAVIVLQHQERWDGSGYPKGLRGEEIVRGARMFAIADTLDAMTTDRPYRAGVPYGVARAEIQRCAGTQFDPTLVEAFLGVPESDWARIRAETTGGELLPTSAAAPAPAPADERRDADDVR